MSERPSIGPLSFTRRHLILLPILICITALSLSYAVYHRFTEDTIEYVHTLLLESEIELSAGSFLQKLTSRLNHWTYVWCVELLIFILASYFISYLIAKYSLRMEEAVQQERVERERLFTTYKQVVQAVTQGALQLLSPEEYEREYGQDQPLLTLDIQDKSDITHIRDEVDRFLMERLDNWEDPLRSRALLCLSEAVTNVVKHTPGGQILVFIDSTGPRFHVVDRGKGLDLNKLPYMLFVKGFSTGNTLGAGFPIMMRYLKQITVCTSPNGTALVLLA